MRPDTGRVSSVPPPGWLPPVPGPEVPLIGAVPAPPPSAVTAARARVAPRIAGYLLDTGLATMLTAGAVGLLDPAPGWATTRCLLVVAVAAWALVRVVAPAVVGESPGKRMLELSTLDAAGAPLTSRTRAFRELVVWLLYWIPLFAPVDAAIAERRAGRSTRDQLAKTSVVGTQAAPTAKVAGVVVLGLLAVAAGWFTLASWDARPARVERAILASCADQGGNLAQCHCLLERLSGDLGPGQLNDARHLLADRLNLVSPSGAVVHTLRAAWSECVGARMTNGAQGDARQVAAEHWRQFRLTAIDACARNGGTVTACTCVLDGAAAIVGPDAVIAADRERAQEGRFPPEVDAALATAARRCGTPAGGADGRT